MSTPTTWVWRLDGPAGPPMFHALHLGEAVRAAVMRAANAQGMARLPEAFHGAKRFGTHDHAHFLSEDRDRDGLIDHVTVHAAAGLSSDVVAALATTRSVWLSEQALWHLTPVALSTHAGSELLGPARTWVAATAYVTPAWRQSERGLHSIEMQLRIEMRLRGLPNPVSVSWAETASGWRVDGFLAESRRRAPRPDALRGAPTVVFQHPVRGPLALGFGGHFGLGLMRPAEA